jgi:uncharacterized membrane protein (UPF0127 family)
MRYVLLFSLTLLLVNCGDKAATIDDFNTRDLTLPEGQVLKVETMVSNADTMRGMMFRTSIAPDHGMLFVHRNPGQYSHWMYQTPVALDTVWMDDKHMIVEIVENMPPCTTVASKCPHFGGTTTAQYSLQMGAGMVKKYHLKLGDSLHW